MKHCQLLFILISVLYQLKKFKLLFIADQSTTLRKQLGYEK